MIVIGVIALVGFLATLGYIVTRLFVYYVVDGVGRVVEAIEEPLKGKES